MSSKHRHTSSFDESTYSSDESTYSSECTSDSESTDRKSAIKDYKELAKYVKPKSDSDILNICYKLIDKKFSYGRYGSIIIVMENKFGYVNATHLCNKFGKKFRHWLELDTSQELITEVSDEEQISEEQVIKKYATTNSETSGTYIHPDIIFSIASWASPSFAVQTLKRMSSLMELKQLTNEKDKLIREKEQLIREKEKTIANLSKQIKETDSRMKKTKK